jgi:hypothetical protein
MRGAGPGGLWRAARDLLADPIRYRQACGAAYCRSLNYRSADIAQHGAVDRKDTDPAYKATRPESPDALRPILALPDVKAGLDTFGITWIEIDDAKATKVRQGRGHGERLNNDSKTA